MEHFNQNQYQPTSKIVGDATEYENDQNCFLREDCIIDFNNLVNGFNYDSVKSESTEGVSFSRGTSETESATEEVEEIDVKIIGDDIIIFQTEDDVKEAYPNIKIYSETQNIGNTFTVPDDLINNQIKDEICISQFQESASAQELTETYPVQTSVKSDPTIINVQGHQENTLDSGYYYVDSFPLTKNPPDVTDASNYDETNLEGVYTVGRSDNTQSAFSDEVLEVKKEDPNEIQHHATESNDNNVIIISMKKFVVDKNKGPEEQRSSRVITSPLPSHKWKRLYECPQCAKKFSHSVNLKIHMEVHTHELHPHKCSQCGVSFAKSSQLMRHSKKHDVVRTKKMLNCLICNASYKTYGHLRHHMIVVHGVNVYPAKTQNFAQSSSSTQVLIVKPNKAADSGKFDVTPPGTFADHGVASGENCKGISAELLKCPMCNKGYKSRGSYRKHINLHTERATFESEKEDTVSYESEENALKMIRSRDELITDEVRVKCSTCGSCFRDMQAMIKHKYTTHRPLSCRKKISRANFSHKRLLGKHLLRSHLKSRTKKQFKCRACGSSFVRKLNSKSRIFSLFPIGKPYRCSRCFSRLITKSNLKRYLYIEKPRMVEYQAEIETSCKPNIDDEIKQEFDIIQ